MTKTIFEEMGGTYRQVGDYLLPNITVPAEEEIEPIGLWGKRHARHLKEHYKVLYMNLLTSGKLHSYLAEVDKQAEDMFLRLVKEYADRQDVTEQLKKDNPYEWIGRMNNIQACSEGSCRNGVDLHISVLRYGAPAFAGVLWLWL